MEKKSPILIRGPVKEEFKKILTSEALDFLVALHRKFEPRRQVLLNNRVKIEKEILAGTFHFFSMVTPNLMSRKTPSLSPRNQTRQGWPFMDGWACCKRGEHQISFLFSFLWFCLSLLFPALNYYLALFSLFSKNWKGKQDFK